MAEYTRRSNLIDVTYQQLHSILSGHLQGTTPDQITQLLLPRLDQLRNVSEPFGSPSDASKKKLDIGSVTLSDGVVIDVEDADKVFVLAISDQFHIDQVHALILLRSFLYNEGLPSNEKAEQNSTNSLIAELIHAITPFYHSERLSIYRTLIPLLRAIENSGDPLHPIASHILPLLLPSESAITFVYSLLKTYLEHFATPLPQNISSSGPSSDAMDAETESDSFSYTRLAARHAKQTAREQLVLLELLFWLMWGYVACSGPLVLAIFQVAYATQYGTQAPIEPLPDWTRRKTKQKSKGEQGEERGYSVFEIFLRDEEGVGLRSDGLAIWIVICIEVLELERVSAGIDLASLDAKTNTELDKEDQVLYTQDPESLVQIHNLVTAHSFVDMNGDTSPVGGVYACTSLAWAYVVSRVVASLTAGTSSTPAASSSTFNITASTIPEPYQAFFASLSASHNRPLPRSSFSQSSEQTPHRPSRTPHPHHQVSSPQLNGQYAQQALQTLHALLVTSPLFVTRLAWKTASSLTDPAASGYRSVVKGLLISLIELIPPESIPPPIPPSNASLAETWIALFGSGDPHAIGGITAQFWTSDWHKEGPGNNAENPARYPRRAIFDVARVRFPVQFHVMLRLLRSMSGSGLLDEDQGSTNANALHHSEMRVNGEEKSLGELSEDRELCAQHVFYYFDKIPTYTYVIPLATCTGPNALYEKVPERYNSNPTPSKNSGVHPLTGLVTYMNVRPVKLPGGTVLPARSTGRVISSSSGSIDAAGGPGDYVVVCWQHEHSGWKVLLEVLTEYVSRRRNARSGALSASYQELSFGKKSSGQAVALRMVDAGVEMFPDSGSGDDMQESIVTDGLDLVRSVIQDNSLLAEELLDSLEGGEPVVAHTLTGAQPPDLVQLTTMILEDALSQIGAHARGVHTQMQVHGRLITSAMSVLSALLALPKYSNRVWLYVRSTTALFGSDRSVGLARAALAAERVIGQYSMTLALLNLVEQLFWEASSSVLTVLAKNPKMQQVKEEVLLKAVKFVNAEIWVEHSGWKYVLLSDRFEIGRRVSSVYAEIIKHAPAASFAASGPFRALTQAVADILLYKATASTINSLMFSLTSGGSILRNLYSSRRYGDARRLIYLLESHLHLMRLVLEYKQFSELALKPCYLEQALCARSTDNLDSSRPGLDPVDALATYVKDRDVGTFVPLEAVRVLSALCASLASAQPPQSTIIAHLSDPEATVVSLVRIVQHPYDELSLRNAVWNFISLAVDKEPALARLFVTGQLKITSRFREKQKIDAGDIREGTNPVSAIQVACDTVSNWRELWELNPHLLASALRFLDVIWQHGAELKAVLDGIRENSAFWEHLASLVCEELRPSPPYITESYVLLDGIRHSELHEQVSMHGYRTTIKTHALHIIGLDIGTLLTSQAGNKTHKKALSYDKIESHLKSKQELTSLLAETASSYDPQLYDQLSKQIQANFSPLDLNQLASRERLAERELGDNYTFSTDLLRSQLRLYRVDEDLHDRADDLEKTVHSINLNLSLADPQVALADAWQFLLRQVIPYLRGDPTVRLSILQIAASMSREIAMEKRSGDKMATIHGTRLSLLLSLLEVAWFSLTDTASEVQFLIALVSNVREIALSESQPPSSSFLGNLTVPFHRTLLQIMYFCCKTSRNLLRRPKALNADQHLRITTMVEASLMLVIDALKLVFDSARSRLDLELDRDMGFLVAVFEQCTRQDVNTSSTLWLARCQETDVIRASLDLFVRTDLVGTSDIQLLLLRKQPLYSPHVLVFHMALASIPSAAERCASAGILATYSNNSLSPAISSGMIDVTIPELPGERSPAHHAYCAMLSIVAGVISALGRNHYFDAASSGFVQLYGDQILRALSWTIGDPITFPLLEEIEQVVNLFYAISKSTPTEANPSSAVENVLRVFATHALLLLQQLNYALTHPNHLTSLLEPVTVDDRTKIERDLVAAQAGGDPTKRPMVVALMHRLFKLTRSILCTLISISRAEDVLISEKEDWRVHEALVIPHSKVVLGEPASMGTLLELGNCSFDVLKDLSGRPAGQTLGPAAQGQGNALDAREGIKTAREVLETTLLYATTQLGLWLAKSGVSDMGLGEGDVEEADPGFGEHLRRGMTGELGGDLQALLSKARATLKAEQGNTDITTVLADFLNTRVGTVA